MTLRDRGLVAGLSVALLALCVAALAPSVEPADAGPQPTVISPGRPYVEGVLGHATNASPFGARSSADRALVALLFRGLVRLGPGGTLAPDLALRWESDAAGAKWTFHLRSGLRWQDGQPLTADDVVFTIRALSATQYAGPGAASWRDVTASASDPLTVTLGLATPLGGFIQAATQPIAPAHLLDQVAPADLPDDPFGQHPIGSGAFALTVFDGSRALLEPAASIEPPPIEDGGPNFATPRETDSLSSPAPTPRPREAVPYLSGIEFVYYDDAPSLRTAWERGVLDAVSGLPPSDATALAESPDARIVRYPGSTLLAVDLDLRPSRPEFRDPAVRRALLAAIDRDVIVADVLHGLGARADSLVPPASDFFDPKANPAVAYDPAGARKALQAAGWRTGGGSWIAKGMRLALSIEVLCLEESANPVAYAVAAAVVANWQAIGLDVRLVPLPAADLVAQRLGPGTFQAAVVPLVIGLDPDLYPLLASTQTRTDGANHSGLQDQSLDKLLAAARAPGTAAKRRAAYSTLEKSLSAGSFILPIAFRDEYVVLRDTVLGPTPRAVGTSGDRFWDVLTWRLADGR
jgi:peptide/nickel transport system substrate-binding protein